jgi:hypothetical protein
MNRQKKLSFISVIIAFVLMAVWTASVWAYQVGLIDQYNYVYDFEMAVAGYTTPIEGTSPLSSTDAGVTNTPPIMLWGRSIAGDGYTPDYSESKKIGYFIIYPDIGDSASSVQCTFRLQGSADTSQYLEIPGYSSASASWSAEFSIPSLNFAITDQFNGNYGHYDLSQDQSSVNLNTLQPYPFSIILDTAANEWRLGGHAACYATLGFSIDGMPYASAIPCPPTVLLLSSGLLGLGLIGWRRRKA